MSDQTIIYREKFRRESIPWFYSGVLHVLINFGIIITLIILSIAQIHQLQMSDLLAIPVVLIVGNFTVWWLHRYPLHRRYKIFPFPYDAHTKAHHRFFTDRNLVYETSQEWIILFFPPQAILGFALLYSPLVYLILKMFLPLNVVWIWLAASGGYFFLYETIHYICHLPEDHFLLKLFWLKNMWTHHKIHHAPELMSDYNFGIVFPFVDYILGTKYKGDWPLRGFRKDFTEIEEKIAPPQ